ncbi:UNVERIFIED_CONTAM: DNA polymerase eta [Sesamum radiatum]|uniref:DNA polymerase eta n=1 Tax=Sesamum radiatum TaxID=300843 RepID=A0AAW2T1R2_SESRA
MPVPRPEPSDARVIAHVDMDCFYVQVEQRKQPTLRGHPTAVVQYNSWKGGGLIAVGYEARKFGVKRSMRGDEAKKVCPDIQLVQVPVARGKADLGVYRNAGSEVVSILSRKGRCERASIDEVYLDLTEAAEAMLAENPPERLEAISEEALKSHVLGLHLDGASTRDCARAWFLMSDADHRDKLLACGAIIVAELRHEVLKETEFTCSAGIAHNKMLAKLASGMNKPAQQTVVPLSSVEKLLESLPIKKITWLWNIARGICGEEVEGRLLPKSHGSGKTFPGPQALKTVSSDLKSGSENGLVSELTQSKVDFFGTGLKPEKQKKKFEKEKGNSSILRFLHSPDAYSFPEHARLKTFEESGASSSGNLLQGNKQPTAGTPLSTCSLGRNDIRNDAWSYKRDEIDPTVLNELPPEIQAEVRGWLHPEKRAKTVKKGSSIVHYFSSTTNL